MHEAPAIAGPDVCSIASAHKEVVSIFQTHDLQVIIKQPYHCVKDHPLEVNKESPTKFCGSRKDICLISKGYLVLRRPFYSK